MNVVVTGVTGAQGGAVARALLARGHQVRGLARTTAVPQGAEPFPGDLADAGRVKEAFAGMTHAAVILPMVYRADLVAAYVANVAEAALAAGVRRLVFNTGNRLPDRVTQVAAFETRRAAVAALVGSGLPLVVLRPALYLENLLAPGVLGGGELRYPLPAGLPVAWLGHADLAELTVAALTRDGLEGAVLDVGGPRAVTGPQLAAAFGARYREQEVDAFASGLARAVGPPVAAEVAATYRWIAATRPPGLYGADPRVAARLGVPLTPLAAWAAGALAPDGTAGRSW